MTPALYTVICWLILCLLILRYVEKQICVCVYVQFSLLETIQELYELFSFNHSRIMAYTVISFL